MISFRGGGGGGALCTALLAGGIGGAAFEAGWLSALMLFELVSFAEFAAASGSSEERALWVFLGAWLSTRTGRGGGVLATSVSVGSGAAATAAAGFSFPTCKLLMICFTPGTDAA